MNWMDVAKGGEGMLTMREKLRDLGGEMERPMCIKLESQKEKNEVEAII